MIFVKIRQISGISFCRKSFKLLVDLPVISFSFQMFLSSDSMKEVAATSMKSGQPGSVSAWRWPNAVQSSAKLEGSRTCELSK